VAFLVITSMAMEVSIHLVNYLHAQLQTYTQIKHTISHDFYVAMQLGDDRENSPLDDAKQRLELHDIKLGNLQYFLRRVKPIDDVAINKPALGSKVRLRNLVDHSEHDFILINESLTFVDYPHAKSLSIETALGTSVFNSQPNAELAIKLLNGQARSYKFIEILPYS
jgi:transcription elongation GreA/GreB family factor